MNDFMAAVGNCDAVTRDNVQALLENVAGLARLVGEAPLVGFGFQILSSIIESFRGVGEMQESAKLLARNIIEMHNFVYDVLWQFHTDVQRNDAVYNRVISYTETLVEVSDELSDITCQSKLAKWWNRKRYASQIEELRNKCFELREQVVTGTVLGIYGRAGTILSIAIRNEDALSNIVIMLRNLANGTPHPAPAGIIDVAAYAEKISHRFKCVLGLDQLSQDSFVYDDVKLTKLFLPQSVREVKHHSVLLHDMPRDVLERLRAGGELGDVDALVERSVREQRRAYEQLAPSPVLDVLRDCARAVVIGDPGAGKSSLLRYLALQWAEPGARGASQLPLIIELGVLYAAAQGTLVGCTAETFIRHLVECGGALNMPLDRGAVVARLSSGAAAVFFDALDEVFDMPSRSAIATAIIVFSSTYPNVRIIITSRVIGYNARPFETAEFSQLMLQEMDDDQVKQFITQWHDVTWATDKTERREQKKQNLLSAVRESRAIRQLAGNPLLLTMMAILNRTLPQLPRVRVSLYEECSRLLLGRWNVDSPMRANEHLRAFVDVFSEHVKAKMLRSVAWEMQTGGDSLSLGNIVLQDQLTRVLSELVMPLLGNAAVAHTAIVVAIVRQLHERNFILSFMGGRAFAFIHRSFLEYFCARSIEARWLDSKMADSVLVGPFSAHANHAEWAEVLTLVCGMVLPKFLGPCLRAVLNAENVLLAARCVEALQMRDAAISAEVEEVRQALVREAGQWRRKGRGANSSPFRAVVQLGALWSRDAATSDALLALARESMETDDGAEYGLQGSVVLRLLEGFRGMPAAEGYLSSLRALYATDCNLLHSTTFDTLSGNLSGMPYLTTLDVRRNGISADGAKALAAVLSDLPLLTSLDVRENRIRADGATALAAALPRVPLLTKLNLCYNNISEVGAKALAAALPSVPHLTTLDVSSNNISDDGAIALTAAMSNVPMLTALNVCNNGIAAEGAVALAAALRCVPNLTTLDVEGNNISDKGIKALAGALSSVKKLTVLGVGRNSISDDGAKALATVLPSVPHLTMVCVSGNNMSDDVAKALVAEMPSDKIFISWPPAEG